MIRDKNDRPRSPWLNPRSWGLINWLAVGSIILVIARAVLLDIPEPMPGVARTGEIVNNLALAYLAAWIFHLIVIERPNRAARRRVVAAYEEDFLEVAGKGRLLLTAIALKKGKSVPTQPILAEVVALCASVHRVSRAPSYVFRGVLTSGTLDWIEYFQGHMASAKEAQERLLPALPFLEPETVALLRSLRNSEFDKFIHNCGTYGFVADSLEDLAPSLFSYVRDCDALADHLDLSIPL